MVDIASISTKKKKKNVYFGEYIDGRHTDSITTEQLWIIIIIIINYFVRNYVMIINDIVYSYMFSYRRV